MPDNSGKIKQIIISILAPVIIIVFLAGSYFAIIDGMINIVESFLANVTQELGEFLEHPVEFIESKWSELSNNVDMLIKGFNDEFDPNVLNLYEVDRPAIVVDQEDFNNIKTSIDSAQVNRNGAGLEDYMLKVMLLSYYRSIYLSDFDVLIEITADDSDPEKPSEKKMIEEMNELAEADTTGRKHKCPFEIVEGDSSSGSGEDGKYYLKTTGMIIIETTVDGVAQQLQYYNQTVIDKLHNNYETAISYENFAFANSLKNFLKTTYTNSPDAYGTIIVPTINDTNRTTIYNYDDPKIEDYVVEDVVVADDLEYTTINYSITASKYGTPVEFLMNLLEITGSQDFLNAFIEVACDPKYYIKIGLYDLTTRTTNIRQEEYTESIAISGTVDTTTTTESGTTGGIREARKRKENMNVTATVMEVINESTYNTAIKEVYCWWAFIIKGATSTETINVTNITDEGKTYLEENNMEQYVSIDTVEDLFDSGKNYITNKVTGSRKSPEIVKKEESPNAFILDPETPVTGRDGLYNLLFNGVLDDNSIDHNYSGADGLTREEVQKEVEDNNIGEDKYQYDQLYFYYTDDLQIKEASIVKTASFANAPAAGQYRVDEVLALLKDTDGKAVEYADLYRGNTGAGELLENGAEMLFQLLDSSENTEGLSDVMRYILYRYNGKDYGVTEFDNGLLGDLDFMALGYIGAGTGYWWPIGSRPPQVDSSGKWFAVGAPSATLIPDGGLFESSRRRYNSATGTYYTGQHGAVDICGPTGDKTEHWIIAAAPGVVERVVDKYGRGAGDARLAGQANYIIILHDDGTRTKYWHLKQGEMKVAERERVERGQVIAKIGSSGYSYNDHLDFRMVMANGTAVDPLKYISASNPRPVAQQTGGNALKNWLSKIEGGDQYINGDVWTVFDPAGNDNTMNLARGMVIAKYNGADSLYPDIIPGKITVGQKVTAEQANKVWDRKLTEFYSAVESVCAQYGVVFNTHQRDAVISYVYRTGRGTNNANIINIVKAYKEDGNAGVWRRHMIRASSTDPSYDKGVKNRAAEEYELFVKGDYTYQYTGYTKYNQFCNNPNI